MARSQNENNSERIGALIERVDNLIERVESLEREVKTLSDTANRWRGGFLLLFTVGGLIGYLSTFASNIWKILHG